MVDRCFLEALGYCIGVDIHSDTDVKGTGFTESEIYYYANLYGYRLIPIYKRELIVDVGMVEFEFDLPKAVGIVVIDGHVLAYDGKKTLRDKRGQYLYKWDGTALGKEILGFFYVLPIGTTIKLKEPKRVLQTN